MLPLTLAVSRKGRGKLLFDALFTEKDVLNFHRKFPPCLYHHSSELVAHFYKDRIFLVKGSKRFELVASAVDRADQTEANLLIPGRRIANGGIDDVITFGIVAGKNIGQDGVAKVARARSEREQRRNALDALCAAEDSDAILVVEYNTLKKLKGKIESAPGIVGMQQRD